MVHVTTLVLATGKSTSQSKQVIVRNATKQDIVIKIKNEAPRAIQFDAENIVVNSKKYAAVNMVFNERELLTSPKGAASKVFIYARPSTKYNQECLRQWLRIENCETNSQLAFLIELHLNNYDYSASRLILDLPGQASLVDPIPKAINARVDENCVTAINIDADTNTASSFDDEEYRYALKHREDISRCAVLAPIMDRLFPPVAQTTTK